MAHSSNRHTAGQRLLAAGPTLVLLAVASGAEAAELNWSEVAVRVYHAGGVAEADERRALATASAILAAADVVPRWTHCHAPAGLDAGCPRPLAPGELTLRLARTRRPVPPGHTIALGEALLASARGSATLATVHLERVDELARRSGADAAIVLGRAIAHELTHLLTGSGRHATAGLMRPVWSAAELARNHAGDWELDHADVGAIRARTTVTVALARSPNSGRDVGAGSAR